MIESYFSQSRRKCIVNYQKGSSLFSIIIYIYQKNIPHDWRICILQTSDDHLRPVPRGILTPSLSRGYFGAYIPQNWRRFPSGSECMVTQGHRSSQ